MHLVETIYVHTINVLISVIFSYSLKQAWQVLHLAALCQSFPAITLCTQK